MMRCNHCGTVLPDDSKFCSACGKLLQKVIVAAPSEPQPNQPAKPEASLQYAGVMLRCLGGIFDAIALFVVGFVIALFTGQTTGDGFELYGFSAFVWWVIGFCYYAAFECKRGATPGKMMLGLRVITTDGEACDCKAAVIRTACRIIDNFFFIGVFIMLFSKRNQRLGDHLANTVVVKTKSIKLSQCKDNQFDNFND